MPYVDRVSLIRRAGYLRVFGLIFTGTGLVVHSFVPGVSVLLAAGLLAAQHVLDPRVLVSNCLLAALLGSATGATLGRRLVVSVCPTAIRRWRESGDQGAATVRRQLWGSGEPR